LRCCVCGFQTTSSSSPEVVSRDTLRAILHAKLKVRKVLGRGSFGEVQLAWCEDTRTLVAVKANGASVACLGFGCCSESEPLRLLRMSARLLLCMIFTNRHTVRKQRRH
jgi:hypothetical protein